MPIPGFLAQYADKAQAALNASPLAQHIPGARSTSPAGHEQPSANQAAAQGGQYKGGAFDSIQHQLKTFGQQYTSVTPVQKIITTEKGVALDYDSLSKDSKNQSKELYTWGQSEAEDIKDVTDRLAYLNFVHGSLASSLAVKLDTARASFKSLRDVETAIVPRRNLRAGIALQISRAEHEQAKGYEQRLAQLKEQLKKHETEDESQEKEIELLKRMAVRQSEQQKWDAIREYGEKLVLLAQAAAPMTAALPTIPPTATEPYKGAQATAAARASLQRALDNYKTGHINLPPQAGASELGRSDTRSFGETHANELSTLASAEGIASTQPGIPLTPPTTTSPLPMSATPLPASETATSPPSSFKPSESSTAVKSPILDPLKLNNSPAPIPVPTSGASATTSPAPLATVDPVIPGATLPAATPTVAETGVPLSAGNNGPGPASGSLHNIKAASPSAGPKSGGLPGRDSTGSGYGQAANVAVISAGAAAVAANTGATVTAATPTPAKYETAEEEKKRLQREDRERILAANGRAPAKTAPSVAAAAAATTNPATSTPAYESADDEKKRLEREGRERILRQGGSDAPGGGAPPPAPKDDDENDLPPYQAI